MFHRQRRLAEQVIVITGATSGIGLATARLAAKRGTHLMLTGRDRLSLDKLAAELSAGGAQVAVAAADVASRTEIETVAAAAITRFGRIDSWINIAGQTIYGRLEEVSEEDHRRLMDVNFWGVVNGSLAALPHLKRHGGTLVNVGSIGSDFSFPMQGMYSASKHAIKGFTDALRMELEQEHAPVSVTLIKPASIDTPLPQRARNYMDREPRLPPPVYRPRDVALAILTAATRARRDIYVGGGGKLISMVAQLAPRVFDRTAAPVMIAFQKRRAKPRRPQGTLHEIASDFRERGSHLGIVMPISLYTRAVDNPVASAAVTLGGVALLMATRRSRRR